MSQTKRVAGYCRVSSRDQAEHGTSMVVQPDKIKAQCEALGWELVEIYGDYGVSGDNKDRPELNRLLIDAKAHKFDVVMFTALDRLGRNLKNLLDHTDKLKSYGVGFYCLSPTLNTTDTTGKLIFQIFGAIAEFERNTIYERTKSGRDKAQANGDLTNKCPYGYYRNPLTKRPEVDPVTSEVYLRIVSMYVDEGFAMNGVMDRLNKDRIPPPQEKGNRLGKWSSNTISRMLNNTAYVGERISNQQDRQGNAKPNSEWIVEKFPALITQERFDQIQAKIEANLTKQKHHKRTDKFLAKKLLRCGHCGSGISDSVEGGGKRFYYQCHWSRTSVAVREHRGKKDCSLGCINADQLDEQIFEQLIKIISSPGKYAAEWLRDVDVEGLTRKHDALVAAREEKRTKLQNLIRNMGGTDDPESLKIFKAEQSRLEAELKEAKAELAKIQPDLSAAKNKRDLLAEYDAAMKGEKRHAIGHALRTAKNIRELLMALPFSEKQRILRAVMGEDGKIEVYNEADTPGERHYNTRFDFQFDTDRVKSIITGLNNSILSCNGQPVDL